jgi:Uma2 family endonuclease
MGFAKLKEEVRHKYTVEQYLEMERAALERSEYINGEIFAMAGESGNHADVSVNVIREISLQLRKTDCKLRAKDTKVRSGDFEERNPQSMKGMFSYPDMVIICGEPEYHDEHQDIILNPKVIIEVLSESTELFDRNTKFIRYSKFNPTLTDYILVSQDKPMVEHFIRQDDESWKIYTYFGLKAAFTIDSIGCQLKLADIYDRVKFSKAAMKFLRDIMKAR